MLSCIVYSRPHMRKNFNILLIVLSVNDGIGLILAGVALCLIFVTRSSHFVNCSAAVLWIIKLGWGWGYILCRNMNLWLTLSVALVRYRSISRVAYATFTKKHIAVVYVVSFILSTNIYLPWLFVPETMSPEDDCVAILNPNPSIMSQSLEYFIHAINLFIPGLLLLVASILIISVVFKAQNRREKMSHATIADKARTQTSRTTTMILVMMAVSAVNQVNFISGFIAMYTEALGVSQEALDIIYDIGISLEVVNCSINFFIYLILPSFRETLVKIFNFN